MLPLTQFCGPHCGPHPSGALAHCSRCHGGSHGHVAPVSMDAKVLPFRRRVRH